MRKILGSWTSATAIFLIVMAASLVARVVSGIVYPEITIFTWALILFSFISISVAAVFASAIVNSLVPAKRESTYGLEMNVRDRPSAVIRWAVAGSLVYIACRAGDVLLNPEIFSTGFTAARYELAIQGPRRSAIGMLSFLSSGAPILLLGILMHRHAVLWFGSKSRLALWAVVAMAMLAFLTTGGRSNVFVSLFFGFFVFGCSRVAMLQKHRTDGANRYSPKIQSKRRGKLIWVALISLTAILWTSVSVEREELRGRNISMAYANLENLYSVDIKVPENWLGFSYVVGIVYFTASFNELDALLLSEKGAISGGHYHGSLFVAFLNFIGLNVGDVQNTQNVLIKPGAFVGLLGGLYVDFGYVGTLVALLLYGVACGSIYSLWVRQPTLGLTLINSWFLTYSAVSPMFSLATLSCGPSLTLFVLLSFLANSQKRSYRTAPIAP